MHLRVSDGCHEWMYVPGGEEAGAGDGDAGDGGAGDNGGAGHDDGRRVHAPHLSTHH